MPDEEPLPQTEPHVPVFDTGEQPQADEPVSSARRGRWWRRKPEPSTPSPEAQPESPDSPAAPPTAAPDADSTTSAAPPSGPIPAPAQPVTVPGRYHYLKWWQLVLIIAGVWIVAAAIGLGLFYWWYHSINKTPAVFVVLLYVVVCTVGGLMLAMAQDKPLLSALAIAVMSALFASVAAAAPLYGYYYCQRMPHCLVGIIPY